MVIHENKKAKYQRVLDEYQDLFETVKTEREQYINSSSISNETTDSAEIKRQQFFRQRRK